MRSRMLGGTIKEMMETETDDHLGYEKSERSDSEDYRNGYKSKRINSSYMKYMNYILWKMAERNRMQRNGGVRCALVHANFLRKQT